MARPESRTIAHIDLVLGPWLLVSSLVWPHTAAQFASTWIFGFTITSFALMGLWWPQTRWLNAVAAAWVIVSVWVLPTGPITAWNNTIVGVAVLVMSLAGAGRGELRAQSGEEDAGEQTAGALHPPPQTTRPASSARVIPMSRYWTANARSSRSS